jgi:uncharacterized membrane protein YcfT
MFHGRAGELVPPAQRVRWVDTGRGLAIVLVALYHATSWLSGPLELDGWKDVTAILSSLRMPLFFVLAGLFAPKWLDVDWRALLRAKILMFTWVFAVWETIGTLVFPLGLASADKPIGMGGLVKALLVSPVLPRFELWFIWALALFFIVAKATRRADPRLQLVLTGFVAAVALTVWADRTTGWTGSAKFYFFFLFGLYARRSVLAFGERARPVVLTMLFVVWAGVSVALFVLDLRGVLGFYFVNCLLGVCAGVAISRALSRLRWLGSVGQQTLPIYLAHTPLIITIAFVISLPPVLALVEPGTLLVPPVAAVVAVLLSLALHRVCLRCGLTVLYAPPRVLVQALEPSPS